MTEEIIWRVGNYVIFHHPENDVSLEYELCIISYDLRPHHKGEWLDVDTVRYMNMAEFGEFVRPFHVLAMEYCQC
jgi:hypothetical protein